MLRRFLALSHVLRLYVCVATCSWRYAHTDVVPMACSGTPALAAYSPALPHPVV